MLFDGPSQVGQALPLLVVEAVQVGQVADVARARAALPGLQAAYLRGRYEKALGDLLDGPAFPGTKRPQLGA
jgi:hypothetical protein